MADSSQQDINLFKQIMKCFQITVKNSIFYASDHPICLTSLKQFEKTLKEWFTEKSIIQIGVSQDTLYLDGKQTQNRDDRFTEIAYYLHRRGITSITISRHVTFEELLRFFQLIRQDWKTIQANGGVAKSMQQSQNLKIMEIDYRNLLSKNTKEGLSKEDLSEEEDLWEFIFKFNQDNTEINLPESKVQLMEEFFKDTDKSAKLINKIYIEALYKLKDENVLANIRTAIVQLCRHLETHSRERADSFKQNLLDILSKLHPDLISRLVEETVIKEQRVSLGDEITKNLPPRFIAKFITSLMLQEGSMNEYLLRIFDKLVTEPSRINHISTLVANQLLTQKTIHPTALNQMQTSIQELFKEHSGNSFMTQMHKILFDSVVNMNMESLTHISRLKPEIDNYKQSIEKGNLHIEKTWLMLNILWLENSGYEFEKFNKKVCQRLPELLDARDIQSISDMFIFYTEFIRPEQKKNEFIQKSVMKSIHMIANNEIIHSLISWIPESSETDMEKISKVLCKLKGPSSKLLLDSFKTAKLPLHQNRIKKVLKCMGSTAVNEIMKTIHEAKAQDLKSMFYLLKEIDFEKAYQIIQNIHKQKNPQILSEVLSHYNPATEYEANGILKIFNAEKDSYVLQMAALSLLQTRNRDIIDSLFKITKSHLSKKRFLPRLVELCGEKRIPESFPYLKKLCLKKTIFSTKRKDDLRISAAWGLFQINRGKAIKLKPTGSSYFISEYKNIVANYMDGDKYNAVLNN